MDEIPLIVSSSEHYDADHDVCIVLDEHETNKKWRGIKPDIWKIKPPVPGETDLSNTLDKIKRQGPLNSHTESPLYATSVSVDSDYETASFSGRHPSTLPWQPSTGSGSQTSTLCESTGFENQRQMQEGSLYTLQKEISCSDHLLSHPNRCTSEIQKKFHRPSNFIHVKYATIKSHGGSQSFGKHAKVPETFKPKTRYGREALRQNPGYFSRRKLVSSGSFIISSSGNTRPTDSRPIKSSVSGNWTDAPNSMPTPKKQDAATVCHIIKKMDMLTVGIQTRPKVHSVGTQLPKKVKTVFTQTDNETKDASFQVGCSKQQSVCIQCDIVEKKHVATNTQIRVIHHDTNINDII